VDAAADGEDLPGHGTAHPLGHGERLVRSPKRVLAHDWEGLLVR